MTIPKLTSMPSLTEIATILGALVILWKALKITPKEGKAIDMGIIKQYEESIAYQLERNKKLDDIIAKLEKDEEDWRVERSSMYVKISNLEVQVSVLQTSVDRLTAQIKSMGGTPVI